ncbi:MAG TPA: HAD family phosphatase [Kofleriaceae bacterium]|jgi:HAD superfamily hydrolase (TIGR01509 family)|nr:HAD family phosphatase [Kofleriaceae bacterium]
MIRGILFDLDGTLVDSERETAEAMARALARGANIAIEQYDRDFIIGRSWVAIYDSLKSRYPQLPWSRTETIAHVADARAEVLAEMGLTILPGVRETLGWTATADLKRAIVTGSSRLEVEQVLPHLASHFDAIVAAEDVARSKPAPDGYHKAREMLALAPHECLVVEDSEAGITAGRDAGCIVLAVRAGNFGGWKQDHAHLVVGTLGELTPSLVDRLARDYGWAR